MKPRYVLFLTGFSQIHLTYTSKASGPYIDANDESDFEDEHIVVTRQEEERDPEVEADFDREFEKMMAESMDSRRFERKGVFDIPLPMKRVLRENPATESSTESPTPEPMPTKTMAFSLMTKKGNKQQVRPTSQKS
jgi:regulator of nonsense transcripts 2